ncbi:MAG: glycine zipper family protein [Oligoflexales bacterium]
MFIFITLMITGCFQASAPPPARVHTDVSKNIDQKLESQPTEEQRASIQTSEKNQTPYEIIEQKLEEIQIQIEREPFTTKSEYWPSFQFSINHNEGFVEIMRCHGNFEFKLLTGDFIFPEGSSYADKNLQSFELEGAWKKAFDDERSCSLISQGTGVLTVQDVAATDGTFYYILNPCVPDFSLKDGQRCSYKLVRTEFVIDFENTVTKDLSQLGKDLAEAETLLNERFGRLKVEAKKIIRALESCENVQTHEMAQKSFLTGLTQLAATATGAVIGGVLGGPQGAVIAGQLLGTVGTLVGSIAFPPSQDECAIEARDSWARFELLWEGDAQSPGVSDMVQQASLMQSELNQSYCEYRSNNAEILGDSIQQDHYKCDVGGEAVLEEEVETVPNDEKGSDEQESVEQESVEQ